MLTVLTWLWAQEGGRTTYTAEHVNIWADMVRRNLSMPHRLACVTDMPKGIDKGIKIIRPPGEFIGIETPTWNGPRPNCFRRLAMFRSDAAKTFGKRFVSMDLDCVIGGPLDPLFDRKEDIVLFNGTGPKRPYNGSMLLMTAGARPKVYNKFTKKGAIEAGACYVGSDQAWLSYVLGWKEKTWGPDDGAHFWGPKYRTISRNIKPTILFFPGKLKPWTVAKARMDPFVTEHYRRDIEEREAA